MDSSSTVSSTTPSQVSYHICQRCVMDTSDPEIVFDTHGVCNHCRRAEELLTTRLSLYKSGTYQVDRVVARMQASGKGKPYDCIVGVSGGVDSTYAAYILKKLGLRPLAVHFDNGWNSELAVKNIEVTLKKLDIDLYTHVVDWEEFRSLQLSFLKASVPDAEIPTDHAIWALLYQTAARFGLKYVVAGTNIITESILPRSWTYYVTDWTYIKNIHRTYSTKILTSYPHCNLAKFVYYTLLRGIKTVSILNSIDYDKTRAVDILEHELGWKNYGGKHHESIYTRFFQSYILPLKFGIDKRRAHLSSLIMAAKMTRDEAFAELSTPIAQVQNLKDDLSYVAKKFDMSIAEFEKLMAEPTKSYKDFKNDSALYEKLKKCMRLGKKWGLLPAQIGL